MSIETVSHYPLLAALYPSLRPITPEIARCTTSTLGQGALTRAADLAELIDATHMDIQLSGLPSETRGQIEAALHEESDLQTRVGIMLGTPALQSLTVASEHVVGAQYAALMERQEEIISDVTEMAKDKGYDMITVQNEPRVSTLEEPTAHQLGLASLTRLHARLDNGSQRFKFWGRLFIGVDAGVCTEDALQPLHVNYFISRAQTRLPVVE